MLRLESSRHGRSVDHVLPYFPRKIAVGSQKPSRITRQKTCCAIESNTSVRVVFANGSGFDAPIGVVLAWEERGSCPNIFRTTNRVVSKKPSRITRQKTCCASESNTSVRVVLSNRSGFDAPIGVVLAWEERGSCLNIFQMTNRGRTSKTFTNYAAKDLLRQQKTCCGNESNTSVRVVFANESGSDAPIGVVLAWEERGSCLNIFRTTNRCRISETFMNYEAKDLLRKSVDHVLTYSGQQIALRSHKPSRITRQKICCAEYKSRSDLRNLHELRGKRLVAQVSQTRHFANRSGFEASIGVVFAFEERGSCLNKFRTKNHGRISETFTNYEAKTCCASESNTSVRIVFANRSGFDAPIGVVLAWVDRGSCLNIFRTTNRGRISESFMNYEAKDMLRKNLHELRGNRLVVQLSQTRRFANRSGFDAPIGVVLAWEERGSCVNIFRTTNHGHITETFTNYEAKDLFRKSVDHVLTYSGRQIAVGSQKPSRITRQKACCASESNTSVRVVLANGSGFDAPI
ncbi:uncharacterized protein G2W53_009819 [Senna tora]|uniref:Uncharacterized protein n=1 Tax=Senna tora TaxID=362788 RepID=A0A835CAJ2_9FABA|nr:uncharacterized protein G2W53_009819 [Senna tora]